MTLPDVHALTPEAQVEWDRAQEACEEPPCRAMVVAGPMPGDFVGIIWSSSRASGAGVIEYRAGKGRASFWSVLGVLDGRRSLDSAGSLGWACYLGEMTPFYRRWTTPAQPPEPAE